MCAGPLAALLASAGAVSSAPRRWTTPALNASTVGGSSYYASLYGWSEEDRVKANAAWQDLYVQGIEVSTSGGTNISVYTTYAQITYGGFSWTWTYALPPPSPPSPPPN